jgi:hypothetical protein
LTIVDFQIQFEAIEAHIQAFYQAFIQLWGFVTTMNTELNGVTAAVSALSEQVTQNTLAIAELQQQQSSQSCFPVRSVLELEAEDLSTSNLNSFVIPAPCFTDGGFVKLEMRIGSPVGDIPVIKLRNISTATDVAFLLVPFPDFTTADLTLIIQKIEGSNDFTGVCKVVAYEGDGAATIVNTTQYGLSVTANINVNESQEFSIQYVSGEGQIIQGQIIGYKSI